MYVPSVNHPALSITAFSCVERMNHQLCLFTVLIAIVNSSGEKDNYQENLRFLLKRRGRGELRSLQGRWEEGLEGNVVPFIPNKSVEFLSCFISKKECQDITLWKKNMV